jgi:tetratricopeptide (TPR) repeat protein
MNSKKISRNDPCPCGSGKKYKQCCGSIQSGQKVTVDIQQQIKSALQAAWLHNQNGRLQEAESICQRMLQAFPNQIDAIHMLGTIFLKMGKVDDAIIYLQKAVNKNPKNPEYIANLGLALHEQGNLEQAKIKYLYALSLDPHYADAHYNLHAALLNQVDIKPAISSLKQVVRINPTDVDAHYMLGVTLDYAGDESASEHFSYVEKSTSALFQARLDAWKYIKNKLSPATRITGSGTQTFKHAMNLTNPEGLILEFGVRFGTSIRVIAQLTKQTVHGFDSFEGLPEVWHHEPKGSYTTKGEIPKVPANVNLYVGWFEDTLPGFLKSNDGPVRFINIDCDIYSSTKTVLDLLASRIVVGSVIVFDEYIGNEHWREDEFKAFQEAVEKFGWSYEYISFSVFTKQVGVRITAIP